MQEDSPTLGCGNPTKGRFCMVPAAQDRIVEELVRRLVPALNPERIYLFGSRARGEGGPDSDFDLLVIVPSSPLPAHRRERAAFRALCGVGVSKDVLVFTREEFQRRASVPTSLPWTVLREGRLIYAA